MSVDKIISAVTEAADEDEFKDYALSLHIPDKTIKYWSSYLRHLRFDSEEAARQRVFEFREKSDREHGHLFGVKGEAENRAFSQSIPVYQDRWGKWRVGQPLMTWVKTKRREAQERRTARKKWEAQQDEIRFKRLYPGWSYPGYGRWKGSYYQKESLQEYAQGNSFWSDFSDGTNGEPSAPAPFAQGQGEHPGLPDYKYIEKLKKLRKRRDPDGIEKPVKESLEDEDFKELVGPTLIYNKTEGVWPDTHYVRYQAGEEDYFLGSVWRSGQHPGSNDPRVDILRQLDQEFPWTAQAVGSLYSGSARFKTMEEAGNWLFRVRFKHPHDEEPKTFIDRWNALSASAKRKRKPMAEAMEDEDELIGSNWVTLDEFVQTYEAIQVPAWGRNAFHKYVFDPHKDVDMILKVAKEQNLSPHEHIWTMYRLVAKERSVFINSGMRYDGGGWSRLETVIGWLLTRSPNNPIVFQLDPRDVQDNAPYIFR